MRKNDTDENWRAVGIATNPMCCKYQVDFDNKETGTAYYYRGKYGSIMQAKEGETTTVASDLENWGAGDIITIRLDCQSGFVHFERNGHLLGKVEIDKTLIYYPAMELTCGVMQDYKVLWE